MSATTSAAAAAPPPSPTAAIPRPPIPPPQVIYPCMLFNEKETDWEFAQDQTGAAGMLGHNLSLTDSMLVTIRKRLLEGNPLAPCTTLIAESGSYAPSSNRTFGYARCESIYDFLVPASGEQNTEVAARIARYTYNHYRLRSVVRCETRGALEEHHERLKENEGVAAAIDKLWRTDHSAGEALLDRSLRFSLEIPFLSTRANIQLARSTARGITQFMQEECESHRSLTILISETINDVSTPFPIELSRMVASYVQRFPAFEQALATLPTPNRHPRMIQPAASTAAVFVPPPPPPIRTSSACGASFESSNSLPSPIARVPFIRKSRKRKPVAAKLLPPPLIRHHKKQKPSSKKS
jgi:hypothetical protein